MRGAAGRELGWGSQQGQDTAAAPPHSLCRGVRGVQRQTAAPGTSVPRELAGELDTGQAGQPLLGGAETRSRRPPALGSGPWRAGREWACGESGFTFFLQSNPKAWTQLSTFLGSLIGSLGGIAGPGARPSC